MAYTWFILLLAVVGTAGFLLLLHGTSLGRALHEAFRTGLGGACLWLR
jgi:hypothetical protein